MAKIRVKRIYESATPADGFRILVDRLWPRGLKKEKAALDHWAKEIAPSDKLRKAFHQHPERWDDFKKRYIEELKENPVLPEFKQLINGHSTVTFLYGARDEEHNQALVLRNFLED